MTRCWCGHALDTHQHYRPGFDCGECGVARCHRYVGRDEEMPATHVEAAAVSDAHFYRNLWALSEFSVRDRPVEMIVMPHQRPRPVAEYLEDRRRLWRQQRGRPT